MLELPYRGLDGRFVCLEPFAPELKEEVRLAIDCDPETWAIMPHNGMGVHFESYWAELCTMSHFMSYAIRRRADRRVVGSVAKLGAVREGVLRHDRRTWTGYLRDSVVFSILDHDWPAVRAALEHRLAAHREC